MLLNSSNSLSYNFILINSQFFISTSIYTFVFTKVFTKNIFLVVFKNLNSFNKNPEIN